MTRPNLEEIKEIRDSTFVWAQQLDGMENRTPYTACLICGGNAKAGTMVVAAIDSLIAYAKELEEELELVKKKDWCKTCGGYICGTITVKKVCDCK